MNMPFCSLQSASVLLYCSNMEETVKVKVFGHEKILSKESISNLQPMFNQNDLNQIHLPLWMTNFLPKTKVLHSCVYYALLVQKELQQFITLSFKERCLQDISDHYIHQRMNFQLYEYSYLCSKILSIPLDRIIHIIYFLVYSRLASKPYVARLISDKEKKVRNMRKIFTVRSEKPNSLKSRSNESRHTTFFCDSTDTEGLKRQLNQILNPKLEEIVKNKKITNKRVLNIRKNAPSDSEKMEKVENDLSFTSRATIPIKVHNRQNSSIISRLKQQYGTASSDLFCRKTFTRKQKCCQQFQSTEKYQNLLQQRYSKENNKSEWRNQTTFIQTDEKVFTFKRQTNEKNAFEYFRGLAKGIKSKNEQYDSIRYSCIGRNDKRPIHFNKQNYEKSQFQSGHLIKSKSGIIQTNQKTIQNIYTLQASQVQKNQNSCTTPQNIKLSVKTNKLNGPGRFSEIQFRNFFLGNITRKDEHIGIDQEPTIVFNQKLRKKFTTQEYKNQYRHFLKTHLFQKTKFAS